MDLAVKLTVLLFGFCSGLSYRTRVFYYVDECLSWADARQYCRDHYTDLGGVNSVTQIQQLNRTTMKTPMVWIGLSDMRESWANGIGSDDVSWRWSENDLINYTSYSNWAYGEPNNANYEYCVILQHGGSWLDLNCWEWRSSVCYDARIQSYVLNLLPMNWWAAQLYCRTFHTDLATIASAEDNDRAKAVIPWLFEGWIGLYRLPWFWSDGIWNTFDNWLPGKPGAESCVAEDENHKWSDQNCDDLNAFICHSDFRSGAVQMKVKTTADITDTAMNIKILEELKVVLQQLGGTTMVLQWRRKLNKDQKSLIQP